MAAAIGLARRFAEASELSADAADRVALVVEEWVANVIEHGKLPRGGRIVLSLHHDGAQARLSVTDPGLPFDPRTATFEGPNLERGGGAGLALIQAWARIESYRRSAGRNRVVFELPLA